MTNAISNRWRVALAACAAALISACSGITNESEPALKDVSGGDWTGDVRTVQIGANQQTLVQDEDGNWVEACSVNYSRCVSGSSTRYEQCARSVEEPGTEDWYQGSCNSGLVCDQDGLEARCVDESDPTPDEDRTISCDGRRVTIRGPVLGGTVLTPSNPYRVLYATDEDNRSDGWHIPYPSGSDRTYVTATTCDASGEVCSFTLISEASRFNFYLQDRYQSTTPSASPPNYWFSLDGNTWTVEGDCEKEYITGRGWAIRLDGTTDPDPDPDPSDVDAGEISCDQTSTRMVVTLRGPVHERTVAMRGSGSALSSPRLIGYGSDTPNGEWDTSDIYTLSNRSSNPRAHADWTSNTATYRLDLPRDVNRFNLILFGTSASSNTWFDLMDTGDGLPWNVTGDCRLSGSVIVRR